MKTIPRDIKRLRGDSKRPQVTTCKRCERKGNARRPQTKQTNAKQLNGDTERPQVDKKQPQKDEKQLQMISTRNAKRQQRNTKQQKTQNSRKKDENRLQTDHTDAQPQRLNRINTDTEKKITKGPKTDRTGHTAATERQTTKQQKDTKNPPKQLHRQNDQEEKQNVSKGNKKRWKTATKRR